MAFVNDNKSYLMDFFFAIFMYLTSGLGIKPPSDSQQRIFPHLGRNNAERSATDISEMLQKCATIEDTGLLPDVTSKDLRSGPVAILYRELDGGVEITCARGGWMIDDVLEKKTGALIFYLEVLELRLVQGAFILGEHDNINKAHFTASMSAIYTEENKTKIDNFIFKLLHIAKRSLRYQSNYLKPMVETCFATFLMWLERFILVYNFS
jgi:hypothetical protein